MGLVTAGIFTIGLMVCILIHELGHCYAAKFFGYSTDNIILTVLGGMASINGRFDLKAKHEFWITVAGPITNVIIFFIIYFSNTHKMSMLDTSNFYDISFAWQSLAMFNLVMAIFNLAPIYPMDGGRIMRSSFYYVSSNYPMSTFVSNIISIIFIGLVGYYLAINTNITGVIIMGIMLWTNLSSLQEQWRIIRITRG
jgi:Zn-dependent protease